MKIRIILDGMILAQVAHTQGCIQGGQPSQPRYVCFDGRTLEATETGFVWNAKRGCFISSVPCCAYNALHYAFYPNPAKNNLNIQNAENSSVKVFDLLGRVVLLENNISLNQQIDVSKLTTGTYLIKIINGNQVKTDKFIITR